MNKNTKLALGITVGAFLVIGALDALEKAAVPTPQAASSVTDSQPVEAAKEIAPKKIPEQTPEEKAEQARQELMTRMTREVDSTKAFDGSQYYENVTGLQLEIALFVAWAKMVEEATAHSDTGIQQLGRNLEKNVSAIQGREFPKMRAAYGAILRDLLWEHDVEVSVGGAANGTLELVGGMFASNKNIKQTQETLHEMAKMLRFDQVRYKWYEYSDYTYYSLESLADTKLSSSLE